MNPTKHGGSGSSTPSTVAENLANAMLLLKNTLSSPNNGLMIDYPNASILWANVGSVNNYNPYGWSATYLRGAMDAVRTAITTLWTQSTTAATSSRARNSTTCGTTRTPISGSYPVKQLGDGVHFFSQTEALVIAARWVRCIWPPIMAARTRLAGRRSTPRRSPPTRRGPNCPAAGQREQSAGGDLRPARRWPSSAERQHAETISSLAAVTGSKPCYSCPRRSRWPTERRQHHAFAGLRGGQLRRLGRPDGRRHGHRHAVPDGAVWGLGHQRRRDPQRPGRGGDKPVFRHAGPGQHRHGRDDLRRGGLGEWQGAAPA